MRLHIWNADPGMPVQQVAKQFGAASGHPNNKQGSGEGFIIHGLKFPGAEVPLNQVFQLPHVLIEIGMVHGFLFACHHRVYQ